MRLPSLSDHLFENDLPYFKSDPRNSDIAVQNFPVNLVSQPDEIFRQSSLFDNMFEEQVASSVAHAWDVGMNTAYFDKRSTITIIDLHPSTSRNPLMKSIGTLCHSLSGINIGSRRPACLLFSILSYWHIR